MKNELSPREYKVIIVSTIGGVLEFYDFIIFALFAGILSHLFFNAKTSTFFSLLFIWGIFAAGYLFRPIGGIILAHFGDKFGRKRIFSFTIFSMAIPTFLIGVLPTYETFGIIAPILLLIFRILQGLAIGGEIPGSATFVYEHINKSKCMTGQSSLYAGLVGGILLGSIIGTIIIHYLTAAHLAQWGWRIPFLIGGVLGFVGVYIRSKVSETPVFAEMVKNNKQAKLPIGELIKKSKFPVIMGFLTVSVVAITVVNFFLYLPSYLTKVMNYPLATVFTINTIGLAVSVFFIYYTGVCSDRYKLKANKILILASLIFLILGLPLYHIFSMHSFSIALLSIIIFGVSFGLFVGSFSYPMSKSFESNVRFSGYSVGYNIAFAIFGGLTPVFNTLLIDITKNVFAPGYLVLFAGIIGIFIAIYYRKYNN